MKDLVGTLTCLCLNLVPVPEVGKSKSQTRHTGVVVVVVLKYNLLAGNINLHTGLGRSGTMFISG